MKNKKAMIIIGVGLVVLGVGVFLLLTLGACTLNDCMRFKQSGSDYCKNHSCTLDDCNEQKAEENAYCYIHNCAYDNCGELAAEFEGMLNYCTAHQCAVEGCENGVYSGSRCLGHVCQVVEDTGLCCEPVEELNGTCEKHS